MFRLESSGHDLHHLKRVLNLALTLQEKEGGDRLVIAVSAFLHDIHRAMQKKVGKFVLPKDSIPKVKELLDTTSIPEEQKGKILHCVAYHEEYDFSEGGKSTQDIETLIVQDADNLDAIGAIGIGRTFTYGGAHRVPMWAPNIPFNAESRAYNVATDDPSTIHHFYSKLLKLRGNMNTESAKEMAKGRHRYMEDFLEEFFSEWKGKK